MFHPGKKHQSYSKSKSMDMIRGDENNSANATDYIEAKMALLSDWGVSEPDHPLQQDQGRIQAYPSNLRRRGPRHGRQR
jgi:hypothetical protein